VGVLVDDDASFEGAVADRVGVGPDVPLRFISLGNSFGVRGLLTCACGRAGHQGEWQSWRC
jgi:hypothetical protein